MSDRRRGPQKKADALLGRFPVTDLAKALAVSGDRRVKFLQSFVDGFPKGSFATLRQLTPRIYGARMPLFDLPPEDWVHIERTLNAITPAAFLQSNLLRGRQLFDHAREEDYEATVVPAQVFRYGRGTAPIGLNFYLTKGERLLFQFPHFRSLALNAAEGIALCSVIRHAYAVGDFAEADVEIVQFVKGRRNREPHILCPDRDDLLGRRALNAQIDDVYAILRTLAEDRE